jgi:leader peptidase (prepilin peptidase)/N-methyltransferase
MTTIVARPLGSRASAHGFLCSCAAASPFLAAAALLGQAHIWLPIGLVAAVAAVAVRHDARHATIPDRLVLLAATVPLAMAVAGAVAGGRPSIDVVIGAVVMGGPLALLHALDPDLFGFGDVKLALALGAALGLTDPRAGLLALAIAAFVALCQIIDARTARVPFGLGLLIGFEVAAISSAVWESAS